MRPTVLSERGGTHGCREPCQHSKIDFPWAPFGRHGGSREICCYLKYRPIPTGNPGPRADTTLNLILDVSNMMGRSVSLPLPLVVAVIIALFISVASNILEISLRMSFKQSSRSYYLFLFTYPHSTDRIWYFCSFYYLVRANLPCGSARRSNDHNQI